MITIIRGSGNHSNRLMQAAYFEAYCMEMGYSFKNLDFADMASLYQGCADVKRSVFDKLCFFAFKAIRKIQNKTGLKLFNIYDYDLIAEGAGTMPDGKSFVCGWNFKRGDLAKKNRDYFSKKYALRPELYKDNAFVMDMEKQKQSCLCVGLHIRRGDYKDWRGGVWYYSKEQYLSIMERVKNTLKANHNKQIVFYIFSNENVEDWFDKGLDVRISKNDWFIDQHIMSRMDYLVGPPSTFTQWASYVGNVPLCGVTDPNMDITMDSFEICGL